MKTVHKISLPAAIIINLNVMLGAGLFVNTAQLAKLAGALGGLSYVIIGVLLLPLILSMVKLLEYYPEGGFYVFGKQALNDMAGFLCAWSYFIGKMSSTALVIHIFVHMLQTAFPFFAQFNTFLFDLIVLAMLIVINFAGVKMGATVQSFLMVLKLFPVVLIVLTGIFLFNPTYFGFTQFIVSGIPITIPLVLHAFSGFEAACSLSRNIQNPKKNAAKAVLFSYLIIVVTYCAYQFLFYGVVGNALGAFDYATAFPAFTSHLNLLSVHARPFFNDIIFLCIAISAISSAFGMIYSNVWNIYILAENNHLPFSKKLIYLNASYAPVFCFLIQAAVIVSYFIISRGNNVLLQQMSALGVTIAYTLSVLSLLALYIKDKKSILLPSFGVINCIGFIFACGYNLWKTSLSAALLFTFLMGIGIFFFILMAYKKNQRA